MKVVTKRQERILKRRLKLKLLKYGNPRWQMSLILGLTGIAAFTVSTLILRFGVTAMWVRYSTAVFVSYFAFLYALSIWIQLTLRRGYEDDAEEQIEETVEDFLDGDAHARDSHINDEAGSSFSENESISDNIASAFDIDESLIALIIGIVAIGSLLSISIYMIFTAPVFLAEILLDAALMYGLFKRVQTLRKRHWLPSAIKSSWGYFAIVLVLFSIGGYLIQFNIPEAVSIGDLIHTN